jgi:fructoselysine-6-P-deglycase FrlB-like protein
MLGAELQMASELQEAPDVVRRQLDAVTEPMAGLIEWSRRAKPTLVVTCARGSSAHAATFAKHLFERHLGTSPRSTGARCSSRTSCCSPSRNRAKATISRSSP